VLFRSLRPLAGRALAAGAASALALTLFNAAQPSLSARRVHPGTLKTVTIPLAPSQPRPLPQARLLRRPELWPRPRPLHWPGLWPRPLPRPGLWLRRPLWTASGTAPPGRLRSPSGGPRREPGW
jgi:hypothetical protein